MQRFVKGWIGIFLGFMLVSSQGVAENLAPEKNATVISPTFVRQFGLGLTAIPARAFWTPEYQNGFFLGGGSIDFLFRVHPQITLELSVGAVGTSQGPARYAFDLLNSFYIYTHYGEISVSTGIRVYLRKIPDKISRFFITPYFVGGLGIQVAISSLQMAMAPPPKVSASQLSGQLGLGLEFRLKSNFALHVDMRGIFRGYLLSPTLDTSADVGLQVGAGFAYFFN